MEYELHEDVEFLGVEGNCAAALAKGIQTTLDKRQAQENDDAQHDNATIRKGVIMDVRVSHSPNSYQALITIGWATPVSFTAD